MSDVPGMRPGENPAAALGRIRRWLELHPDTLNVASEIGVGKEFISDGWPFKFYAIDRRDLLAVLDLVEINGEGKSDG